MNRDLKNRADGRVGGTCSPSRDFVCNSKGTYQLKDVSDKDNFKQKDM